MKRLGIVFGIFILMMLVLSTKVCAADVQLLGENEVVKGQEQKITLKISNDEAIGAAEGNITFDSNIEGIEVSSSYNGWITTYNATTGKFNSFKAEGVKTGEIIEIKYRLKDTATSGRITISNLELTTITYNAISIPNSIVKNVTAKNEVPVILTPTQPNNQGQTTATPTPTQSSNQGKTSTPTPTQTRNQQTTATPTQANTKSTTPTQAQGKIENVTPTPINQQNKQKDNSTKLPKTGERSNILVILLIILSIIIGIVMYKKTKEYKEINK